MRHPLNLLALSVICSFCLYAFAQNAPVVKHVAPQETDPRSGAEMYRAYCAVCHGLNGKGDGPAAAALKQAPADLTQISKKNGGKFPDFYVERVIQSDTVLGPHGSREMPMWGDVFRTLQRDDSVVTLRVHNLTEYIAKLQQK